MSEFILMLMDRYRRGLNLCDMTGFCFEVVTLLCEKGTVEGLLQGCEMMAAQPGAGRGDGHVGGIRT